MGGRPRRTGARRLTTHEGIESHPRFSPGRRAAGLLRRVRRQHRHLRSAGRRRCSAAPDLASRGRPRPGLFGRRQRDPLHLVSQHLRRPLQQLYTVPVKGRLSQQVPLPHAAAAVFSPDDTRIAYRPHWEAFNEWKHYRGGTASRIVIFDRSDLSVEQVPWPEGRANDTDAMWVDSSIYFRSDRHGEFNLYSYDPASQQDPSADRPRATSQSSPHRRAAAASSTNRPATCTSTRSRPYAAGVCASRWRPI